MEEQYVVSARKYRPANFRSVVGQHALTETLKNAIASRHLAHAYLFCGPRGVGKTTCARIFAKAINCEHLTPEGEACEQCESCRAFNEQRSFNIHELDAASNNGVEDIRTLVDQVRIPPQVGRYSVYIVDEVHMLSTAAFNAFLKTLEEPPAHAIFILATTEKHKILPTILSRCQIYDFNRITVNDMVEYLQYVASNEGVTIEKAALNVIAKKADGAMRDALSIFDQVVSFCGKEVTYKMVIEDLNVLDSEYYFRLIDMLLQGDVMPSMLLLDEVLRKGFDAQHFVSGLASHIRDLMMSHDPQTVQLLEVSDDVAVQYAEQSKQCSLQFIFKALELTNKCSLDYKVSQNKRLLVELLLTQLSQINNPLQPVALANSTAPVSQPAAAPKTATPTVRATVATPMVAESATPYKPKLKQMPVFNTGRPTAMPSSAVKTETTKETNTAEAAKGTTTAQQPAVVMTNAFDDRDLRIAWNEVCEEDFVKSSNYCYMTMRNMEPTLEDGCCVLTFAHAKQQDAVKQIEKTVLSRLQEKLKNTTLTMKMVVDSASVMNEVLTPEQHMKSMREKNPAFDDLVRQLHLEFF
ncbi:MAG: DNA polymerase III subunit gamma/tau [Bacteroidales bacterium]|nr:DNA polymerase III subunit gamma/tau [Bacteroidales bacterium]